jgi:hypothetical protein
VAPFAKGFGGCEADAVAGSSDKDAHHRDLVVVYRDI